MPEIQEAFKAEHGRDLAPPKTQMELLEVAKFFQGREIDGQKRYGAAIFTERGSEGITMGATSAMYPFGFKYEMTPGKYDMEGAVNSPDAVAGLEFYKELYKTSTPPGYTDSYMEQSLDAFKSGQVAMAMNWFAFFPGLYADPDTGGDKIGFFVNPGQLKEASTLGGQGISVVRLFRQAGRRARIHQVVCAALRSEEVVGSWGLFVSRQRAERPNFADSAPFAADFLLAMDGVMDFWQSLPMQSCCWLCKSAFMTMSWLIRVRQKRPWTS